MAKAKQPVPAPLPPSAPCPTQGRAPFMRVIWTPEERPLDVIFVGQAVYGMPSHWYDARTIPCDGTEHGCPGCNAGYTPRWTGYAAVVELPRMLRRIMVVPESAYRECAAMQALSGGLRGTAWRFQRMGKGKKAAVKITRLSWREEVALPEGFDIPAALARLWDRSTRWVIQQVRGVDEPGPNQQAKPGCRKKGGRSNG